MSRAANNLELYEAVLSLIERKRSETGDSELGDWLERAVIETQFKEVESEILDDPGAIEPWLIRRRRDNN